MSSPAIKLLTASVVLCFGCASFAANQTINTDLVVVGAGSAGLSAAVQGAELGKKVVLLEKIRTSAATPSTPKACLP